MRILNFCSLVVTGLVLCNFLLTDSAFAVVAVNFDAADEVANSLLASTDDFGFANVGARGSASGVYLGNGWVLTAKHVSPGDITFNGITYHYEAGSAQYIENPAGYDKLDSTYTDLTLFHLTEEPDLPSLKIANTPPSTGTELFLAGNGVKRQDELTYWEADCSTWTWTESEKATQYWGYKTDSTHELSWGKNQVIASYRGPTSSTHYLSLGDTDMVAIKTCFDNLQTYEGQAVNGDSGGGAFYWDEAEESWVLAGIISCIEVLPNSPTYAMAGASTCCVDLSFYRDAILEAIAPEPIPGDANGDGVVDGSDITIVAGSWQQVGDPGTITGDLNNDGVVNGSDITILAGNWQYGISTASTELENSSSLSDGSTSTEVPEPTAWTLLLGLALSVFALKRNR